MRTKYNNKPMNRDQQLKTLNSPKASKEQLREALACALGVTYERQSKEKEKTLFALCRDTFLEAYKEHAGIDYSFVAKDGVALSSLITKLKGIIQFPTDTAIIATFRLLLLKLPEWYKQNAFSLTRINGSFNEIVASIKQNGDKTGITDDSLESKLARRANARRSNT
ncbi:hypothetical protein M2451_003338 [Dysgonomonas sp. PFB1-18]|uniref:hypothetical protein n=1 Tax=unclassified Dysgonomonas TaxID=2630389 RepID=UPI002474D8EC|nr:MULTISPECIES: hypothetical protein [unclassified Dysgonomonas]MDH6310572.1 hypothetical protein [Dysgonomonas sp. PF1-14]MDH6340422.1 hypothetical protein [Dysgonomonas sp. PF1-16]MDH6381998.1 hypothetical protein [Dysgonomonas sp. PFB1-18]MDH6399393.1 hypothetical protein [Dysgonomonas sp. PF1-23]